jgi:Tfp pilus assembly protein PilN
MSTKKINLLPKEKQEQLRQRTWYKALLTFYVFAGISFAVVIMVYLGVWWYLSNAGEGLKTEADGLRAQANSQVTADLKKQIKGINAQITDYNTLADAVPRWSKLFNQFAQVVPAGVQIQGFTVDSNKRLVNISGIAPTRELVIELHDNIAKDTDHFSSIDYPLENVSRPKDVSFHYSFLVKEQAIQ